MEVTGYRIRLIVKMAMLQSVSYSQSPCMCGETHVLLLLVLTSASALIRKPNSKRCYAPRIDNARTIHAEFAATSKSVNFNFELTTSDTARQHHRQPPTMAP